jgi:hypothetical protein
MQRAFFKINKQHCGEQTAPLAAMQFRQLYGELSIDYYSLAHL